MASWIFVGRVYPERIPVTWGQPLSGNLKSEALDIAADYFVTVQQSQVVINLTVTQGTPSIHDLRNVALDLAHQITDIVGYASGCHFNVEIISAISRDTNDGLVFGRNIPAVAQRANPHRGKPLDGDLVVGIAKSIPAQMILRDFQLAMQDAVGTGFYCYRAIEAMMQSMKSGPTTKDKDAWTQLNHALCLDRTASEQVKRHADLPRHGKESSISDAERAEVFRLTDEIIYRYLELVRRGVASLPSDEFPILTNGQRDGP